MLRAGNRLPGSYFFDNRGGAGVSAMGVASPGGRRRVLGRRGGRRWGGLGLGGLLGGALEFAGFFRDSMDGKVGIRGCDPAGAEAQLYFQLLAA